MIIGVPKEIKPQEKRVSMTPAGVGMLVDMGHQVLVESSAGIGIGATDEAYLYKGAQIMSSKKIFQAANLIVKVKEPQLEECAMLNKDQLLFTYLHLAPDPKQTEALVRSGVTAIAYETITSNYGDLPLLAPMSEVAGRLSIQAGMLALEGNRGGMGILLGGVPGTRPAQVTIIGGGVVGTNAAKMAHGVGANVTILDRSLHRLRELDDIFSGQVTTLYSQNENINTELAKTDLLICSILIPGADAPKIITKKHLEIMRKGSVIVDVAIDQGGACETSKATTHQDPTYIVNDVVHYCVANMPGSVPRTATYALTHATFPFIVNLAQFGLDALKKDPHFKNGLNVMAGKVTNKAVCNALPQFQYHNPDDLL